MLRWFSVIHLLSFPLTLLGAEPLRDILKIRQLTKEQAEQQLSVEIEGQVTFHDLVWQNMFITHGKSGIYVDLRHMPKLESVFPQGVRLRVKGVSNPGHFFPIVQAREVQLIGLEPLPKPQVLETVAQIFDPSMDSQFVQIQASVKRVLEQDGGVTMVLEVGGQVCNALFAHHLTWNALPTHLIEHRISVQGVALTRFNNERQMTGRNIFVPSIDAVTLLNPERKTGAVPLRQVNEVLSGTSAFSERVRVQGTVTYALPEHRLYLRGKGGSMRIETALTPAFQLGSVIEAEGYATMMDLRPGLNAIVLRLIAHEPPPQPIRLPLQQQRTTLEQCEFVSVEAELVQVLRPGLDELLLICKDGDIAFQAHLRTETGKNSTGLKIEPGSRLRLQGICELEAKQPYGLPNLPSDFRLYLRSPEDVTVIAVPSYWTANRLIRALSIIVGLACLVAAWAYTLKRRVSQQAEVIRRQTEQQATLEERQRIARELHDTLEQELTGVAMLLDTTATRLDLANGKPAETLNLARGLLRHSREESRSTIRDLRSVAIEQLGLVGALKEVLRPLAESAGLHFESEVRGEIVPLNASVETALLRVAHEAVANAAKHSKGKQIHLCLNFQAHALDLIVKDDGIGFDPQDLPADSSGHFGITGMQERAAKLGAQLHIRPSTDHGTTVTIRLAYT